MQNKHSLYNPQFRPYFILNVLHWWLENAHFWIYRNTITVLEHFLVFSIVAYRLHLNVSVCIELHNYLSLTFRFIYMWQHWPCIPFYFIQFKRRTQGVVGNISPKSTDKLWKSARNSVPSWHLWHTIFNILWFGMQKKIPYPAYYLEQTVCEVNICALDSTKVILFVYLWETIKLSTRQKALMTTAGHNYIEVH